MADLQSLSEKFQQESKFVTIDGNKIHYTEVGDGEPLVFLPSKPISNYSWRNVIPHLSPLARCLAPDFIGTGKSDKPTIEYCLADHIYYIEEFLNRLGLQNIILVLHSWGAMVGFECARRNPTRIRALAFVEAPIKSINTQMQTPLLLQEINDILQLPKQGYELITNTDYFIDKILPAMILRKLSKEEVRYYRQLCQDPMTKRAIWQYLREFPIYTAPAAIKEIVANYSNWLMKIEIPKLMLYVIPGFYTSIETVMWAQQNLPNLEAVEIGHALHFPQETVPQEFGEELARWYRNL